MLPANRNIELKTRLPDPEKLRVRISDLSIHHREIQHQIDTYFKTPTGRLKLREINHQRAELIAYVRSDSIELRGSDYRISPVHDSESLKSVLEAALGIVKVVKKRREILLWKNVRIHIDEVEGLGHFVEFEAVISKEFDEQTSTQNLAWLVEHLQIDEKDRLAGSYVDLG